MDKGRREYQCLFAVLVCVVMSLKADGYSVGITYLRSAVAKGAVCLDGSAPAYHFDKGVGAGINNWLILLEGGSWCNNVTVCAARRTDRLGSSDYMATVQTFSGMLHNQQKYNPDFYNWNRIKVRYCDGSSYTGDVAAVNPADKVYYRGARIFAAVIEDLLAKGMKNAENAILSGCSAGGLGAILQCDNFKSLVPKTAKVKCIADAGYFINAKAINGISIIEAFYNDVVTTHESAKNLPASYTSKNRPGLCFFPQNVAKHIQTPLFIVNAAYDTWQVKNILAPGAADRHGTWRECKTDITKCTAAQLNIMHDFRLEFLKAISSGGGDTVATRGLFINSCYSHCQTSTQGTWLRADSPLLGGTTISKAVGDWYFDRRPFKKIGCPYPCDKTCHNRVFELNQQPLSAEIDI